MVFFGVNVTVTAQSGEFAEMIEKTLNSSGGNELFPYIYETTDGYNTYNISSNDYVNGECDIEDIEDIVATTDKLSNALKQSAKFHQFLANHDIGELLTMNENGGEELDFNLRRIYKLLNKRYGG